MQGVDYIVDLRRYNNQGLQGIRATTAAVPPNFYEDDLKKLKEKRTKTAMANPKYNDLNYANLEITNKDKENTLSIDHLVRKRMGENGTGNISQVLFETTMRQGFGNKSTSKIGVKWNNTVYSPTRSRPITGYIPPCTSQTTNQVHLHENDYVKKYDVVREVIIF